MLYMKHISILTLTHTVVENYFLLMHCSVLSLGQPEQGKEQRKTLVFEIGIDCSWVTILLLHSSHCPASLHI